jgi:nitrite reductase/ring-hydroxylating ferredoxin subunit
MARWVRVASVDECPTGKLLGVMAEGMPVVLANVDGKVCALRDQCSHEEFPLSDGELEGDHIVCIYHGARFDACSGDWKALPAVRPVQVFPVDIDDGVIYVDME